MLRAGSRLGSWTVVRFLGKGGMGSVFEAVDDSGRKAALKVVSPDRARDADGLLRFERESRAARSVRHANVVQVLDAGVEDAMPWLATELVPGGSLAQALATRGRLPWRDACRMGAGIARGLAAVHGAGLVHRDVKPGNVLVDARGEPRVADFGLVRGHLGTTVDGLTATGEIVGTFEYLAPEQAEPGSAIDARADLYALGATLHHLIAGRPPFDGVGFGLVRKHLTERPRSLRDLDPTVPEELARLVLSLLEKDPARRPASASLVARELDLVATSGERRLSRRALALVPILVVALVPLVARLRSRDGAKSSAPGESLATDELSVVARDLDRQETLPALAHADLALALDPRLGDAWSAHAHARSRLLDGAGALADAEHGLALAPSSPAAWTSRALAHYVLGHLDLTERDLGRALELDHDHVDAVVLQSYVAGARGQPEKQLALARRATALAPRRASTWYVLADLHKTRGDLPGAIAALERAIEADPGHSAALARRGILRAKTDAAAALPDLDRAIALFPRADAHAQRAELAYERGDLDAALADATRAIELDPRLDTAWVRRASIRIDRQHSPELIQRELDEALAACPKSVMVRYVRASVRFSDEQWREAIAELDAALALDTRHVDSWALRAKCREQLGDLEGAISDLERALQLDPANNGYRNGLAHLRATRR